MQVKPLKHCSLLEPGGLASARPAKDRGKDPGIGQSGDAEALTIEGDLECEKAFFHGLANDIKLSGERSESAAARC